MISTRSHERQCDGKRDKAPTEREEGKGKRRRGKGRQGRGGNNVKKNHSTENFFMMGK